MDMKESQLQDKIDNLREMVLLRQEPKNKIYKRKSLFLKNNKKHSNSENINENTESRPLIVYDNQKHTNSVEVVNSDQNNKFKLLLNDHPDERVIPLLDSKRRKNSIKESLNKQSENQENQFQDDNFINKIIVYLTAFSRGQHFLRKWNN